MALQSAGLSGAVFDAVGPRLLIPGSGIVVVFSIFMLSITKPQQIWQQYLCQGVLFNIGATFGCVSSLYSKVSWTATTWRRTHQTQGDR